MITQLPEFWCIRQNKREINNWFNIHTQNIYSSLEGEFIIHYPGVTDNRLSERVREGYTEITFEEFEALVLNKTTIPQYEIY